jgi:hypothetical protein
VTHKYINVHIDLPSFSDARIVRFWKIG